MPKVISALTARTQFGQIMERAAENDERFIVDRRGEPKVVIMSVRDFVDTVAPAPDVLKAIWSESRRKGTDKLSMREIDAEVAAYRRKQQ
ncbi:MAG: type II toxin-antitoxin system Phd/YefM family antitoxin [Acidobacteria bacterium]|nr:type II toxin-antitoxin system Phd/YefM family antitoxin [Acidobacteriota bacterium]